MRRKKKYTRQYRTVHAKKYVTFQSMLILKILILNSFYDRISTMNGRN
jgi:hypothetical protein